MSYKTVGLDITTGHAVDSFFYTKQIKDPWAEHSLKQTINLAINHEKILFPLPSNKAKEELDFSDLPKIFAKGGDIGIKPFLTKTADDITFPSELLNIKYILFSEWAIQNPVQLVEWATYHRETPSLKESHLKHVPIHKVSEFWNARIDKTLNNEINLSDDSLLYSFDVFVRGLLYSKLFTNNEHCFFHPIRDKVFGETLLLNQYDYLWSWGDYFINQMKTHNSYYNTSWLIEKLISVKEETIRLSADWYSLANKSQKDKVEAIENVAIKSNLPAELKNKTKKIVQSSFGLAAAATFTIPLVSAIFAIGAIAVEWVSDKVPGKLGSYKVFKGQLKWPNLIK